MTDDEYRIDRSEGDERIPIIVMKVTRKEQVFELNQGDEPLDPPAILKEYATANSALTRAADISKAVGALFDLAVPGMTAAEAREYKDRVVEILDEYVATKLVPVLNRVVAAIGTDDRDEDITVPEFFERRGAMAILREIEGLGQPLKDDLTRGPDARNRFLRIHEAIDLGLLDLDEGNRTHQTMRVSLSAKGRRILDAMEGSE